MKTIALLGSTGSIGTQTLEVIAANAEEYRVSILAANRQIDLLEQQIERFKPEFAVVIDELAAVKLKRRYQGPTVILSGIAGVLQALENDSASVVLNAFVGFAGLKPTLAAIQQGKDIALANKETLVAAGAIVTELAQKHQVKILPVDSEHSAIFQCLQGEAHQCVGRLILTASGGPFRNFTKEQLEQVTIADCLNHPNWSMGQKITIDSATLVNKGLEVIEAHWLFGLDYDAIDVVVHPQSIVHSLIETTDGAVKAQLGLPDMKVPIQYALTYPLRSKVSFGRLDLCQVGELTFVEPDVEKFPALALAYEVGRKGGTYPCIFNAANEIAVYAFLAGKIKYTDIVPVITHTLEQHDSIAQPNLEVIFEVDAWARQQAHKYIGGVILI